MKKQRIIKIIGACLAGCLQFVGIILLGYSLILYKGLATFYRVYVIVLLLYIFAFSFYMMSIGVRKKGFKKFVVPLIVSLLFTAIEGTCFYYLNDIYTKLNDLSNTTKNVYYSSLVTYDKTLTDYKSLNNVNIGIVSDKNDIEGYVLPNDIITELKLKDNNTIKEYDSTMALLSSLKQGDIKAAFFSTNYTDMFYSIEGYENIGEETKVLYSKSKEYISKENDDASESSSLTKPFTILLLGVDSSRNGVTSGYNADVQLLVTFNPKTLRATVTSIPRDTYLKTACSGSSYRRINTTTWGSSSTCAVNTVENLFDVNIDYYAKVNFKGIVQLVNSLGGIDVNVPYAFCEQSSSRKWGKSTVFVEKGNQHLNGEQALALARNRHSWPNHCSSEYNQGSRNDYVRGRNQIKVIMGIIDAATKLNSPSDATKILETVKKNFQTNVKAKDITNFYNLGKSILIGGSNLINVQRSQLKSYSVYQYVYDPDLGYPAVDIPYNGSINDIKNMIKINLGKTKPTLIKKMSFDLNKPYSDSLVGQDNYSQSKIAVLKNLSSSSVSSIKSYCSNNGISCKFVNYNTKETVSLDSWGTYKFYSQNKHVGLILSTVNSMTIYVKENITPTEPITE